MIRCPICECALMGAEDPSPAEARVLVMILRHQEKHGRYPTYDEIGRRMRWRSSGTVHEYVHKLEYKGWLSMRVVGNRSVIAAAKPWRRTA